MVNAQHRGSVRPTHPGQHLPEQVAMDLLDVVLESYAAKPPARPERDEAQLASDERLAFLDRFRKERETMLRTLLEEAAWRLDQRGHHAWIEEVTTDGSHPSSYDSIALWFLPIGYIPGDDEASSLTFRAAESVQRVEVREHIGGTAHTDVLVGLIALDDLEYENVALLAAELVRRAFDVYPPVPTIESTDPSIARD